MEFSGVTGGLYRLSEWVVRLAYVNILWILFSIIGLIFLGFFPSVTSLFTVIRKWVKKDKEFSIFGTYWTTFRAEFIKANILGYILLLVGFILYIDVKYFFSHEGTLFSVLQVLMITITVLYLVMITCFFAVYVHYNLKLFKYFKQTILIVVLSPLKSLLATLLTILIIIINIIIPVSTLFFGLSLSAYVITKITHRIFIKIDQKNNVLSIR